MGAIRPPRPPASTGAALVLALAIAGSWFLVAPGPAAVPPLYAAQVEAFGRCDRITAIGQSALSALDDRLAALRARRAAALATQAERWADQDARLEAELAALRQRLADRLASLHPTTDEQREAIAAFRAAVGTALEVRQAAIGTATREYRSGVLRAIEALFAETLELFAAHREVVRAHIARAHAECAGGTPAATVIEALQASLAAARADLAAGLAELPSLAQRIAPLQDTMRSTLAEVHAAFTAALEAAAAALKAAFGGR
jgi:ABC-type transporter Mla subunit MlaD